MRVVAAPNMELTWKLRVSRRARHARLQIRPYGGLEVVIPTRFPRSEVAHLVERHAGWARKQLARQSRLLDAIRLPESIHLAFDDSVTPIHYVHARSGETADLFSEPSPRSLTVDAACDREAIRRLRQWIRRRAQELLPPLLRELSTRSCLDYARVTIRSQKTRWGSCSSRGSISLNDQCLFLPAATVEYLMIHELCHTRELNHSRRFWDLVASHFPDYRAQEKLLGRPRDLVPDWFLFDLYNPEADERD